MDIDIVEFDDKEENKFEPRISKVRHSSYNSNLTPLGRLSNPSFHSNKRKSTFKRRNGIL